MKALLAIYFVLLVCSVASADDVIVEWEGRTKSGHHLLHVEKDGKRYSFPVDPKDFNDEEAMSQIVDDAVKIIEDDRYDNR